MLGISHQDTSSIVLPEVLDITKDIHKKAKGDLVNWILASGTNNSSVWTSSDLTELKRLLDESKPNIWNCPQIDPVVFHSLVIR